MKLLSKEFRVIGGITVIVATIGNLVQNSGTGKSSGKSGLKSFGSCCFSLLRDHL